MLLEEIWSVFKNSKINRELDRFRILCYDIFKLEGGIIYCFEIFDNLLGVGLKIFKERLEVFLSFL